MHLEPLLSVQLRMRPHDIGNTPTGRRLNLAIEGEADPSGRVRGHLEGVDYATVRGDGVIALNVQATLTGPDGVVAIRGTGLAAPGSDGWLSGRLALELQTAAESLGWLNRTVAVAATRANHATGELNLTAFTLED
jgi:hypothetical protein